MPRDGNGQYSLPTGNPVVPGTIIESEWANVTMQDLGQALSTSISYDGQTVPVNNLPMDNYRHTGVSDPSQRNQYLSLGMSQDSRDTRVSLTSGSNNLIGALIGGMNAYSAGQVLGFQALFTNTGPVTLNVNGIGPRDVVSITDTALVAGQIVANKFYNVLYTGSQFQLQNASLAAGLSTKIDQNSITGWDRPESGVYPSITIASPTSVTIPAGSGTIVPPGDVDAGSVISVTWSSQTITLDYLTTAFQTTLAIDVSGAVIQIPDQVNSGVYRSYIILGVVGHISTTVDSVTTTPAIYGDDGYLNRDISRLFNGMLITGGKVTQSGANPLAMDVGEGTVFYAGGDPTQEDSPNFKEFSTFLNVSFRTLAGLQTVSAPTNLAPITNYDPNFSGTVTAIPGGTTATVIHRLYWIAGSFVWVYGQYTYASLATAIADLAYDRARFQLSRHLSGATWVAEIVAQKNCLALSDANTCVIVARGGFEYVIGTVGGLDEAPQNGTPYGRQNASWVSVLGAATPNVTGNVQITKADPRVVFKDSPAGSIWSGLSFTRADNTQRQTVRLNPDGSMAITTHDGGGVLVSTTTLTNAGNWTFPGSITAKQVTFNTGKILSGGVGLDTDLIIQGNPGDFIQIKPDNGATTYVINNAGIEIPVSPTLATHAATKSYVDNKKESLTVALGSEGAPSTTGIKSTFRWADYAFTLTNVKASLNVAQSSGTLFTINVTVNGVSIFSTLLTFNNGSKTTVGATTPAVISNAAIPADAEVIVLITQVGDGTGIGPKICFTGHQ